MLLSYIFDVIYLKIFWYYYCIALLIVIEAWLELDV